MKKAMKKIIVAGVALVAALGLATGTTFAWFSMNDQVTVTGMSVTTQVSSNLFISETNVEADFTSTITQSVVGKLRPASTANGATYFYTTKAAADGSYAAGATGTEFKQYSESTELSNTTAKKANVDTAFNTAYNISDPDADTAVYAYVDYSFYLKAISVSAGQKLSLTTCNLKYNNNTLTNTDKAWRVAVFFKETSKATDVTDATVTGETVKSILAPASAAYFTSGQAISGTTPARSAVTGLNTAATINDNMGANETKYYKVVIRFWLEGEDTSCNNETYINLTSAYTLNLAFTLGTNAGVTQIGSVA